MSQLEEQILKQNILEEHRQVHELQVRIKELRADVERYVAINAQLLEDLEKAETQLAKLREQEPLTWGTSCELMDILKNPIYSSPAPAPAVAAPAAAPSA